MHPTRDFNFVADTVAGFVAALGSCAGVGEVINIGSNFEISIGDTANVIAEVMGAEIEVVAMTQRLRPEKSEVERLWAANDKARQTARTGGRNTPACDGFRRGFEETVQWFVDPKHLSAYRSDIYNL